MPVYECYCPDCHTIFSFFSRRVDNQTRPDCPRCARPALDRQMSLFAISKGRGESDAGPDGGTMDLPPGVDEERMMQVLSSMSGEMEHLDDADPKQAARMMRKLFDATGLKLGEGMTEAMRRMEAGEDPEEIDAQMGDILADEDPFGTALSGHQSGQPMSDSLRQLRRELLPVARDDNWYPLKPTHSDPEIPST